MSKGGSQSVTQNVDPATQRYVEQMRQAALGAQSNPLYAQGRQLGGVGLSALGGDAGALQQLMGGYGSQLDPYWNQLRQTTLGAIGDQATQAGAFGGSRQGVAEGAALGQIAQGQAGQRYGEYQNALGRAGQLANLGFGVDPQMLGLLNAGIGPYGQTQTTHTQSDPFSQILGGGLTLASLFAGGPAGGAMAGGLLGGGGGGGGFPAFGSSGLGNIDPYTGQPRNPWINGGQGRGF
jgi:hypothetical protein